MKTIRNTRFFSWAVLSGIVAACGAAGAALPAPPLDFVNIVHGPPDAIGRGIGTDATGAIYTVGFNATNVTATAGALQTAHPGASLFVRKYSPDGTQLVYSALPAEIVFANAAAKVDSSGNVYLLFGTQGAVAGVTSWNGPPVTPGDPFFAVVKIGPKGDHVLYATRVSAGSGAQIALDVDSAGVAYVAIGNRVFKLDAAGVPSGTPYTLIAKPTLGGQTFDNNTLALAVAPDHSVYVAAGPNFVYRVDLENQRLMYQKSVGGDSLREPVPGQPFLNIETYSIAVDRDGSAYVAGQVSFPSGSPPFPLVPIGYSGAIQGSVHSFLVKLDAVGNTVYADSFSTENLNSLAVDSDGNVWAAGASAAGFTIFALDSAGGAFRHYLTLPAINGAIGPLISPTATVVSMVLDSSGRVLVAGSTPALQIPDIGAGNQTGLNAFFARVIANPPSSDLQLITNISPPVTSANDIVTISISLINHGPASATNVMLKYAEIMPQAFVTGQVTNTPHFLSCRTTGGGTCTSDGMFLRMVWAEIASGARELAEIKLSWNNGSASIPYSATLTALTSSDNPNQDRSNSFTTLGFDGSSYLRVLGPLPGFLQIQVNDLPFNINYAILPVQRGIPVVANTDVSVYVPTPQVFLGQIWAFTNWSDGSTENPRVFHAGPATPDSLPSLIITMSAVQVATPSPFPDSSAVNAASFHAGPVAPGEVVTVFGANLGPQKLLTAQLDRDGRIATNLGGLQVFFDDVPAPIIYASAGQASVIVPYSVAGKSSVAMRIQYNQLSSGGIPMQVADSSPGLFTANSGGSGPLAAFNQDGSHNTRDNPAARGDVVVFYGTGEGLTDVSVDGGIAGGVPPKPKLAVSVTIGGKAAEVLYAGGVSGQTAGLLQLNVRIPSQSLPGLLPVVLTIGAAGSQGGGTIAVQ